MIKINNKTYNNNKIEIIFDKFINCENNEEMNTLNFYFIIKNDIQLEIETKISNNILSNMNINNHLDINKYITDIEYQDENGYTTLIHEKYYSLLTRINEKDFNIKFKIESNDINIKVDEVIKGEMLCYI